MKEQPKPRWLRRMELDSARYDRKLARYKEWLRYIGPATLYRHGKLVAHLQSRLRRWKRRSAAQHRELKRLRSLFTPYMVEAIRDVIEAEERYNSLCYHEDPKGTRARARIALARLESLLPPELEEVPITEMKVRKTIGRVQITEEVAEKLALHRRTMTIEEVRQTFPNPERSDR